MITVEQIRGARGLLGWTQGDLAKAVGMSLPALNNIERKASDPRSSTLGKIAQTLIKAGIEFISPNSGGAGVRIKV